MIKLHPFQAIRPKKEFAADVAAPPYDVLSDDGARKFGENPRSIVHITRSEVNFPKGIDPYSDKVYQSGRDTLEEFLDEGILFLDDEALYIYTEVLNGVSQRGIVGVLEVKDYREGRIKDHELTLKEKQKDRTEHFYRLRCQTEPVFFFHEKFERLEKRMADFVENHRPEYDFTDEAGVRHILHKVEDSEDLKGFIDDYRHFDALYIADGHHRTASAADVCERLEEEEGCDPGFMAVIFPREELNIMGYHRVIRDLNGLTRKEFLDRVEEHFTVEKTEVLEEPREKGTFLLVFDDENYLITAKDVPETGKVADSLDVTVLQEKVLDPILGIKDIRNDSRIEFYGGFNAFDEIRQRMDDGFALGILLHPITAEEIIAVSDNKEIMPPKSTWFEPKLKSGLFLHPLK